MSPVKIHIDIDLVKPGYGMHWLIRPLVDTANDLQANGARKPNKDRPIERILSTYRGRAASIFELAPLEDCDFVVVPLNWHEVRGGYSWAAKPDRALIAEVQRSCERARKLDKPVVIFFSESRSHEPVPVPGAVVFRNAVYRSRRSPLDQAMPVSIIADPKKEGFEELLDTRMAWDSKPTVGFCGFSRTVRPVERLSTILYKIYTRIKLGYADVSQFRGLELRNTAIEVLRNSTQIKTNLIVRGESVFLTQDARHAEKRAEYRLEFMRNIVECDYQLCMRGSANHSRRPWETLSCGRTPAFVDTDCVLPFDCVVDWSNRMPIVDESDITRLPEAIAEFHARFESENYEAFQDNQRRFWKEWLTPEGFAAKLAENYQSLIVEPSHQA